MATPIIMPKPGITVESCIITKWHKKKGDPVNKGDILFSYETDKAAFDEESTAEGILLEAFYTDGDDVPCLSNTCVIGREGEQTAEFASRTTQSGAIEANNTPAKTETSPATAVETASVAAIAAQSTGVNNEEMKLSPRAKMLADKTHADLSFAVPTGPNGRIIERDIRVLIEKGNLLTGAVVGKDTANAIGTGIGGRISADDLSAPKAVEASISAKAENTVTVEKLSNMRKAISKSMGESLSTMAQLTLNSSFDATEIIAMRSKLKASGEAMGMANITYNDMVLFAVAKTLTKHKFMNANLIGDEMHFFSSVNLGMAVDTDRGLMVPVIFNADAMSLSAIASAAKEAAGNAKKGAISPDAMRNGSFTVTNLGTLDVESFTPVINPPQTGILGVCNITRRARETENGVEFYPAMGLSLTFDHKALDGAPAAKFLKDLKTNLENFSLLLAL